MANPNTIPWLHYQDIQIPDVTLQQQFEQYWITGQYAEALSLLSNNATQLQGKAFIASTINTIASGIEALENKYYQGVPVFLSNLASQYSTLINNLINKRTWNPATQYTPYNFVVYNSEVYMCISQPPIGTVPTNTTYWLYVGLRGEAGAYGLNVNMRYEWNPNDTYNVNDLVVYGSAIYVATTQNTGVIPGSNSTWDIFLTVIPGGIIVSTTAPDYPTQDTVWFQVETDPLTQTTDTPIVGQFNRYDANTSTWEPMYPNTIFTWVDDRENYAPPVVVENVTIASSDWVGQQYTYSYSQLNNNSFVQVLPTSTLTNEQYTLYSTLSISIENTNIILTTTQTNITIDLPIIIKIQ